MGTQTLKYENGVKVTPLFSKEEYDQRLSKLRKTMEERKLEVAIFTSMHNVGYFSNFFYCAFGRPYAQVVTPEKNVTIRLVNFDLIYSYLHNKPPLGLFMNQNKYFSSGYRAM